MESGSVSIPGPAPLPRRQQKLQLMVEQLAERNAALEREVGSLVSSSLGSSRELVEEPPPVYVESPEPSAGPRTKRR